MHELNRLPHYHERLPFIVLWSQKAGSTAVLRWFFEKTGLLEVALKHHPFVHRYESEVLKNEKSYAQKVRTVIQNKELPAVKFVRDPAARAFSGYLFLNRPLLFESTNDPAFYWRMHVLRFTKGKAASPDMRFSFNDYLLWLIEGAPRFLDGHFARQKTNMEEKFGDNLDTYKIETLTDAFRAIENRFILSLTPERKLNELAFSTHHIEKHADADTLEMVLREGLPNPADQSVKIPVFSSKIMQTHPDTAELIKTYFAADYKSYGYSV